MKDIPIKAHEIGRNLIIWSIDYVKCDSQVNSREKGRDLTQSYENPLHPQNYPKSNATTQNATKNFYTTICVPTWSIDSYPTGVLKPVYGIPTFPLTGKAL